MSVVRGLLSSGRLGRRALGAISHPVRRHQVTTAPSNILYSDLPDVEIPEVSIQEYVFSKIDQWPNHIATECAISGQQQTYDGIRTKMVYLGRALHHKLKLKKGDVLGILLPNCPQFSLAALGALNAGLTVTTLNPIYTPDEICRQLKDSEAKVLITLIGLHPLTQKAVALTNKQIPIITIKTKPDQSIPEGALNFDEFLEKNNYPDPPLPSSGDVAFLPYSSGTTGLPKGVQLTHKNIIANLSQYKSEKLAVMQEPTDDHQDTHAAVLPKFHIYGLTVTTLHPFTLGTKTVVLPKFTPELYLSTLRKYKPDILFVAPPIITFLTTHSAVKSDDLQCIRTVICGAAPLGRLDEERFLTKARKDINVFQGYGLTETSPLITMFRQDLKNQFGACGSIGRPISNSQMKIVALDDPTFTPLGPNQTGEMLAKGPQVMKGYHNRPEETKDAFTSDGWFRTGDIAYYNDDGLLFVTDRLKELIKVKGFQVPPAELEEIIRAFPDVAEAGVVGIPDPKYGEIPRAFIVQKPGKQVDVDKLKDYVAEKVAPYKQLKGGIEVVESIPKNAAGKILRRDLKLRYEKNKGS